MIKLLDHGLVRLVSYMQPVPEYHPDAPDLITQGDWTGDLEVVRNARVSYNADWRTGKDMGKDQNLINFMYKNHHSSPFEAMVFNFEVKAPLFVVRQWHRHRTWAYNEVSARYTELPEEFYIPQRQHVGRQSTTNKQARDLNFPMADEERDIYWFCEYLQKHSEVGFSYYQEALCRKIPRELARCFLGLNTYTRMFAKVDLHNLMHFLRLRLSSHSQWEIQQYARALVELIGPIVPITTELFEAEVGSPK